MEVNLAPLARTDAEERMLRRGGEGGESIRVRLWKVDFFSRSILINVVVSYFSFFCY